MGKKKVRLPLSRKIAIVVLLFALLLSAVQIFMSYTHYKRERYADYEKFASDIAAVAASQINPDLIEGWLEKGEPDEEYKKTFETLSQIRENGGIEYLYVVKPEPSEVYYVLDTDPSEGAIPLGYHESYYAGDFAENAEKMVRGEKIEPIISNEEFGWLMSVYYPMFTSDGRAAGYVGVDILMNDVVNDLSNFALKMVWLMLVLTAIFVASMIFVSNKLIASPIRKLSSAAKLQMEEDMNTYIRELVTMTSENERISAELSLANRIQTGMIPHIFPAFPERSEFNIYASMNPAKEVGGDFYDFFLIDEDHLAIVMADVSGKGIPAALFMMASKIILQSFAMLGKSAAEILTKTNEAICANNQEEMFVTVWLGILEISSGKVTAANAGHEYPVVRNADGSFELFRDRHGFVIGGMDGLQYKDYELQLQPGSKLFVYTDGVTEATDSNGDMFGTDRMVKALNSDASAGPEKLLKNVRNAVNDFVKDAEQFDDLTMLCLEYLGSPKTDGADDHTRET